MKRYLVKTTRVHDCAPLIPNFLCSAHDGTEAIAMLNQVYAIGEDAMYYRCDTQEVEPAAA